MGLPSAARSTMRLRKPNSASPHPGPPLLFSVSAACTVRLQVLVMFPVALTDT
ncbi:hypothetical protein P280DRAFT_470110 [Massarina eburnea CBS 473.64]|uniref:Uncharacterized protein n=1 Tax=Massarina eburnea CBS 473.64 TaxID=1395130 RepID=A0A6A6RZ06_9PLEO|nr:hypothetical protein P280DRAFT_470110 [Massarina eburnea CBS 473.64]